MPSKTFDRQEVGQPIRAETLNGPIAAVERLSNMSFASPIDAFQTAGGTSVRIVLPPEMDARITAVGTGGKYAWRGIAADADNPGVWLDMDSAISGTTSADPLFERNGNATLTVGTRVLMKRRQGLWVTTYGRCS